MNTTDVPDFKKKGFDNSYYKKLQMEGIKKKLDSIKTGHLYLEIGGKLFFDAHGARVLPGFDPKIKVDILKSLGTPFDMIFCMNYSDIMNNRQLSNHQQNYIDASLKIISDLKLTFGIIPHISINNIKPEAINSQEFSEVVKRIYNVNPNISFRYYIQGYPENAEYILSQQGFGKDNYIPVQNKLVIVTGSASNSGKLSTCLGMIYQDSVKGMTSSYAKYETFPIWNLPLEHPINLAYEAATADIGDRNVIDPYYQKTYGKIAVNYNRDVQAFSVINKLMGNVYSSPTDMGINHAGSAITNDEIVCVASLQEIQRRNQWYSEVDNKQSAWIKTCEELENDALKYIREHGYNPNLQLV